MALSALIKLVSVVSLASLLVSCSTDQAHKISLTQTGYAGEVDLDRNYVVASFQFVNNSEAPVSVNKLIINDSNILDPETGFFERNRSDVIDSIGSSELLSELIVANGQNFSSVIRFAPNCEQTYKQGVLSFSVSLDNETIQIDTSSLKEDWLTDLVSQYCN